MEDFRAKWGADMKRLALGIAVIGMTAGAAIAGAHLEQGPALWAVRMLANGTLPSQDKQIGIDGIQEIPASNEAVADLHFNGFTHLIADGSIDRFSGTGKAIFSRYTNGSWVLRRVQLSDGHTSWTGNTIVLDAKTVAARMAPHR